MKSPDYNIEQEVQLVEGWVNSNVTPKEHKKKKKDKKKSKKKEPFGFYKRINK